MGLSAMTSCCARSIFRIQRDTLYRAYRAQHEAIDLVFDEMKCIEKSWKSTVIRQISTTYRLLLLKKEEVTQPKRSKRSLVLLVPVAFKSRGKVTKSRGKVTKSKTLTLKKCHCLISKGIQSISVQFLEPPQRSWNALVYPIKPRTVSVTSPPLLQQDICR